MRTFLLRSLAPGLLLLALALACYLPGLAAPYHFDSAVWLEGGRLLSSGALEFALVVEVALNSHAGPLGRPLAMLSFGIESWLAGGMFPVVSNSINLALHLLNAALVFLLLSVLVGRMASPAAPVRGRAVPLLVAAIWLLHPLQASTVLYTVQRMSILAATFSLIGILLYTRLRERLANGAVPAVTVSWLITGIASCTVLGVLAKESAVLLPWFLVLVEVCFFGYVVAGRPCSVLRWSSRLMILLPVGLAAGLVLLFPHVFDSWYQSRGFTVEERLLSEARILWRYLGWIYWPASPGIGFHHDDIAVSRGLFEPWTGALAVAAWLAVFAGAWRLRVLAPWITFAAGWYLVAHALESTIVPLELVFEHRNYLALLGPLLLVPGLAMAIEPSSATRQRLRLLGWVAVAFCAGLLAVRASYWGDESAFAARELRTHPQSARALFHYANTALREGESARDPQTQKTRILEARQHYELLLEREPAGLVAPATLLYIDSRYFPGLGATSRWMELIEGALGRPKPTASDLNALHMLVDCLNNDACAVDGGWAATLLERAADRAFGGGPFAHYQAARYFMGAGRDSDRARQHLHAAMALQPGFVDAYALLAQLHAGRGERAEAVAALASMMRADPRRVRLASVLELLE